MDPLLKKLNYKDESEILIIDTPEELVERFKDFHGDVKCVDAYESIDSIAFALIFVLDQKAVDESVAAIKDKLSEDCKLWFCYPKKSSKRYKSEINRDNGWKGLGELRFEPVRQVAVNEDFSALRFRQVDKIKTLTRSKEMAMTQEAKDRTADVTAKKKEKAKIQKIIDGIGSQRRQRDAQEILQIMDSVIEDPVTLWEDHYIGYGFYHYVNKTNEGDMPILSMVPAKAHMTLYFSVGGLDHYEDYLDKIGHYKRGKICLYISNMDRVDKDVFRDLIKQYYEDVKSGKVVYET